MKRIKRGRMERSRTTANPEQGSLADNLRRIADIEARIARGEAGSVDELAAFLRSLTDAQKKELDAAMGRS